jgi:formylglycine-generating enzyme required for sulfatase activity
MLPTVCIEPHLSTEVRDMTRLPTFRVVPFLLLTLWLLPTAALGAKAPDRRAAKQADKAAKQAVKAAGVTAASPIPPGVVKEANVAALRMAVEDLIATFGDRYRNGKKYLQQVADIEKALPEIEAKAKGGDRDAKQEMSALAEQFRRLQQEALLANPLLDFDRLLLVKRGTDQKKLGLPQNWQGNCALPRTGYDNEIAVLSPVRPDGKLTTLFKPEKDVFVGDVDLHWSAERMLFSMPADGKQWQVWEIKADGSGLRQVTPDDEPDAHNYDACYLPDGRIVFDSTRCFHGVPCVGGGNTVANLFIMQADGSGIRQLCFDQDHDWCPTVMNDGRLLYSRWEYSDSPHYFTRLLFHMNPDGTNQAEYYGSNSPWPNSLFYARPIPGHPTKVAAVISGHHGVPRMGEFVVFDPAKGRQQADGAVQRIPGHGVEVQPKIGDSIVNASWPKFLHPYPLSEKHFLVSMQPNAQAAWGIYLVDTFDNLVLVREEPDCVLFEPVPLRKTPVPPVIPDRVDTKRRDATVYLADVYAGKGLEGVPRGTVKKLRIYEPHYAYPGMGGHIHIGVDGPWDARRIHGTVPVEADGSANFTVPANTPLAVQPLDEKGQALQVMRSWFTAMPGESVACVGCHESQNTTPPQKPTIAMLRKPTHIEPWHGPARPFSFTREVQPVLDKHCVGCHDGTESDRPNFAGDRSSGLQNVANNRRKGPRNFTASYLELHRFVRRPGPESDYFMQKPLEWHAGTSELMQMLDKGHHNVKLDAEARERLVTWIDLNVPDHGTWSEHRAIAKDYHQRRLEMRTKYANRPEDPEAYPTPPLERPAFVQPQPLPERKLRQVAAAGWPFDAAEAKKRQSAAGTPVEMKIELSDTLKMDLVLIPAGEFVIGAADGAADEYPSAKVKIARPFYMGRFEVTNAEYAAFDPKHDSAYISVFNKDQANRGEAANRERQPVIRVSWQEAMDFCRWLSAKTGRKFSLPTEAQWEYACRAGSDTPMNYGACGMDFGKLANLADQRLENLCRRDSPRWIPAVTDVNDGAVVTDNVGRYPPNAWGLCDMHGNAAEWTRTAYRPYPYDPQDGRDDPRADGPKSVRGGSFYDRPERARSAFRSNCPPWQKVFNVGFRVVMEVE